jgi:hypothetical protein
MNKDKSQNVETESMNKTYWNLILAGAAGGALIMGSFNVLAAVEGNEKFLFSSLMAAVGILVMYYARYY